MKLSDDNILAMKHKKKLNESNGDIIIAETKEQIMKYMSRDRIFRSAEDDLDDIDDIVSWIYDWDETDSNANDFVDDMDMIDANAHNNNYRVNNKKKIKQKKKNEKRKDEKDKEEK